MCDQAQEPHSDLLGQRSVGMAVFGGIALG